ncbi:MAG: GTP cyclohydrolase I FolE [Muribaculaceae bacterium]|nr:GTP cyclohydrolase I FolE [Muribaculaceae bacterium]
MKTDKTKDEIIIELSRHYEAILRLVGEDPEREGLVKTPLRAAKAMYFATRGYEADVAEVVNGAIFTQEGSRMIIVKDIEFYSFCEHHILPFFGKISIGYVPDGKIVGLSKLARLVNVYARRLQVQERLTAEISAEVLKILGAKGVMVYCEAEHLCMKMRGVEKQHSSTVTTEYNGVFESDASLRREFLDAIR